MMKFSYTIPVTESTGVNGELRTTKESVVFDENTASIELLGDEIRKLEAQGWDVTVTLKLKMPKD